MFSGSNNKLVSIVLPTYNGSRYLRKAIKSCLEQTYNNIELIIVNDGSIDDTADIIRNETEGQGNVKIVTNEFNHNLPYSLNKGFDVAEGAYFTWTSDDNLYSPNAIEELVKNLEASNSDIVYSSYEMIDEHGKVIDYFCYNPNFLIFKCVVGACFLYKKEVHEKLGGYDTQKFRMEDYDFWLRAVPLFKLSYIDNSKLYKYRKHKRNLSSGIFQNADRFEKFQNDYFKTFDFFFNQELDAGFSEDDLHIHVDLFFNSLIQRRNFKIEDISIIEKHLLHFSKLADLPWERVNFEKAEMHKAINDKRYEFELMLLSTLLYENARLKDQNPQLAKTFSKDIFWYYKEYEALPWWYKKFGNLVKVILGRKSLFSIQGRGEK